MSTANATATTTATAATAAGDSKVAASASSAAAPSGKRGAFILFEGLDRSGKSTQCVKLYERLVGDSKGSAVHMRFPDRETSVGKMIDAYLTNKSNLNDQAIHLLFSANRWENSDKLRAALNACQTVVCDRYSYSGVAFSSAKGLPLDWCLAPEKGLPAPDVVIFMKLNPADAEKRGGYGTERYEKAELQAKVATRFEQLKQSNWTVLDGGQSIAALQDAVYAIAAKTIAAVANQPIATI